MSMPADLPGEVDVVVVGSGAAGLTAAVVARQAGLDVLVLEKEAVFGGTTATSGGVLWIPGNRHSAAIQQATGKTDSIENARAYLEEETGNYIDRDRVEAYLATGPEMVDWLEANSHVRFYGMDYPDYHSESTHASSVRSIGTLDFKARDLGPKVRQLKNMLPQTLFMGLAVGSGVEMIQFMRAGRSIKAMGFVVKKMLKHFVDVARYGEAQQVVRGRALVARLARTLFDAGTEIRLSSPVTSLIVENGMVNGVTLADGAVRARRGVVLACGGFPNDPERRARIFPASVAIPDHRNPTPVGNTGDGIRMAEAAGGAFNDRVAHVAPWMPISVIPGKAGSDGVWPHLVDRQKPGFISVLPNGRRFGDESAAYHDFIPQLVSASEKAGYAEASCWLIGDARGVKRWGIGVVRPYPVPHGQHLRSGYLKKADTLAGLAAATGIDAAQLEATVAAFNANARQGIDPDFGRGQRAYDLYQGEEGHEPNPCLGPLENAPFYAVKVYASEIGTYAGLRTDADARVLSEAGDPIPGLYAVGNDQTSVFAGAYPGAGSTLGPAMTFAYRAGRHLTADAAGARA